MLLMPMYYANVANLDKFAEEPDKIAWEFIESHSIQIVFKKSSVIELLPSSFICNSKIEGFSSPSINFDNLRNCWDCESENFEINHCFNVLHRFSVWD